MKTIIFAVDSPTRAIKAKNIMQKANIKAKIVKLEDNGGCKHGVEISSDLEIEAISLLRTNNIRYSLRYKNDLP